MSIPKIIHQTFKTGKLPLLTRWHISRFRKKNPDYVYEFYDDLRIEQFLSAEFDEEICALYKRINIGAAKADFFRYAILYKKGGIYLDIDSGINKALRQWIEPDDVAIITREGDPTLFAQWALIYSPGHPFLEKTIEMVLQNLKQNKYPHDVHKMTGPTVYTEAINAVLVNNPETHYRLLGVDYNAYLKAKYKFGKFFLYKKGDHWRKKQVSTPVLKSD